MFMIMMRENKMMKKVRRKFRKKKNLKIMGNKQMVDLDKEK